MNYVNLNIKLSKKFLRFKKQAIKDNIFQNYELKDYLLLPFVIFIFLLLVPSTIINVPK